MVARQHGYKLHRIPDRPLRRAISQTHTGHVKAGPLVQGLIWERHAYPAELETLLSCNASTMILQATEAAEINPPATQHDVLITKTGSTNGFSAYVAFIPSKKIGVVILANKNYPLDQRVSAAHQILNKLSSPK